VSSDRVRCERWFVRRGLPHLIDSYSVSEDVLTRTAPFLALVVFVEVFLSFGDRWAGFAQAGAFIGGVALMAGGFVVVNRLRGRRAFRLPDDIGWLDIGLYLLLPAIPTAIGAEGSVVEAVVVVVVVNLAILVIAAVVTSWGLLPMMRWSVGQLRVQITHVLDLALKSLPILLLFSAFIFLNAEMWQVANDFTLPLFAAVAALLVTIGSAFVGVSVRRLTVDLARFSSWSEVGARCGDTPVASLVPGPGEPPPETPRLTRRAEWNLGLLLFVAQAIQILLVAVVITGFYLLFGLLTVREDTLLQWTTVAELTSSDDWARRFTLFGDELIFTRQLVFVSAFIGIMSGLQFAVQLVTDESYRAEFADDMTSEIREALAVRAVYLRQLVT
jgi:hypothetical protein